MKTKTILVRLDDDEKEVILKKAKALNFTSVSEYIRVLALNNDMKIEVVKNAVKDNDNRDQDKV